MAERSLSEEAPTSKAESMQGEQRFPNATSFAQAALTSALRFCVGKLCAGSEQDVFLRLQAGDRAARDHFRYQLAKQVAKHLGDYDDGVKAAYLFGCDTTQDDNSFGDVTSTPMVHLLVWAKRHTAALSSLIIALDRALVQCYSSKSETTGPMSLLDIQVVVDADVEKRIGYGALLSSLYHRPLEVWHR